ncbi:MAG: DUF2007 domain-containing protein [Chloroflexi bacterium]|nr:DUF2007 domain-containing protein [Chloroflexota bacterium]
MADDLVQLGVTDDLEAGIWRDALAQESIPIVIRPASASSITGIGASSGNVQVFVRAADEKRARWIIGDAVAPLPRGAERASTGD